MKKSFVFIGFSIVFTSILLLVQFKNHKNQSNRIVHINQPSPQLAKHNVSTNYEEDITYHVDMADDQRKNITFIMNGGDSENNLVQAAEKHFRLNAHQENDKVVNYCGSILNIIDYLSMHKPENGEPWGNINIVQYSDDWKGIHILTEEERTTSEEIFNAMDQHSFNPLKDAIVDAETEIMIDGMGIGNNEALLKVIALAFGGSDEESPTVRSSKFISTFDATENESKKYITESYFGFFSANDALQDEDIITQFQNNYPNEEMDWAATLDRTAPRFPGDTYSSFQYETDLQTICILRAMTIENDEAPYTPLPFEADLNDSRFFTTITATPKNDILSFNEF